MATGHGHGSGFRGIKWENILHGPEGTAASEQVSFVLAANYPATGTIQGHVQAGGGHTHDGHVTLPGPACEATITPVATCTPTPTSTSTATSTSNATWTATATTTATSTSAPADTPTSTATAAPTSTSTATPPTVTATSTSLATATLPAGPSPTQTPAGADTPTATATATLSAQEAGLSGSCVVATPSSAELPASLPRTGGGGSGGRGFWLVAGAILSLAGVALSVMGAVQRRAASGIS